jgi:hypothetical protein
VDKLIPVRWGGPRRSEAKLQQRIIFPDFSAFQMTVDAVPVRPDPGGAGAGRDDDAMGRQQREDALGPDAWPGFAPTAARKS